jgi:5'-hydroxyaverantin dehydrogenase
MTGDNRTNFVSLDVTSWPSQVQAFKAAVSFPPTKTLDIVFLNAGIAVPTTIDGAANDPSVEPADPALKVYDVNLVRGVALALHYFALPSSPAPSSSPTNVASKSKKAIILTGSLASYLASPTSETYGSSKFGVRGLFKGLRNSLSSRGVRINMVAPT